jgi:hypothetical protein
LSAQHFRPAEASASIIRWCRAAVRPWVDPGRAGEAQSRRSERIGEDLDVHAVALVLPGVVRGVGRDEVDRQQRAVEDDDAFSRIFPIASASDGARPAST